jgi:hypothetical protein
VTSRLPPVAQDTDELLVPLEDVEVLDERFTARTPERRQAAAVIPVVQAAAAAAGGFVAGAAVVGLVGRRQRRSRSLAKAGPAAALTRRGRRRGAARGSVPTEVLQIVSSRKMLVDVHLLGSPGSDG